MRSKPLLVIINTRIKYILLKAQLFLKLRPPRVTWHSTTGSISIIYQKKQIIYIEPVSQFGIAPLEYINLDPLAIITSSLRVGYIV
jgi:hypothetical protein